METKIINNIAIVKSNEIIIKDVQSAIDFIMTIKLVEVKNVGKQISQEKLDKIFEKFYRLDSSRNSNTGGSGLGLAIAKDIVELHNGTITAQSDKNETIFKVILPIS